jgi:RNA polymerase sigma-70 factor, ECF subfamily
MEITRVPPNIAAWDVDVVSQPSDRDLLLLIAQGDKAAFRLLLARHKVRVYRHALRLVNHGATAEDIVSQVFFEVWRCAAGFEGRSQVSTWLLGIARNLALKTLRQRSTESLDERIARRIEDSGDDPETALQKTQQSAMIARCLSELSPSHREIIDLVYFHGKSINDLVELLGIPRNTVKTRMFYARNAIAKRLKGLGIDRDRPWETYEPAK